MTQPTAMTRAVRAGLGTDPGSRDVVAPVHLSTTYVFPQVGQIPVFDYSRSHNPTRSLFAQSVAQLESGFDGVATASGMGAITATLEALVPEHGLVVAPFDCYGGTYRLLDAYAKKGRWTVTWADLADMDQARAAIGKGADLVLIETPSNPLLRVTDIEAVSALAHQTGAIVVADNTFATPIFARPLELGADVVVHSATKYLAGHSDVILGVAVMADRDVFESVEWWANCLGVTAGATDCYLGLRGLRTLKLRVEQASASAGMIAQTLRGHAGVDKVFYPGFGGIISLELPSVHRARSFVAALKLFCLAESLGGVESIVAHPATMTHVAMPETARLAAGITDGTLRLSVGIEDTGDLVSDILQALDQSA